MGILGKRGASVVLAAVVLIAGTAQGISPADKCEAKKLKVAGKYGSCRLKAQAKAVKTGAMPNYSQCDGKFSTKWSTIESNAGGMCPTNGDLALQTAELTRNASLTAWRLSGMPRFVDNADGTITDNQTGLTWVKQIELDNIGNYSNPLDADNQYRKAGYCTLNEPKYCQPTAIESDLCAASTEGDAFGCAQCAVGEGVCNVNNPGTIWSWVIALNNANFGGHSDWRIPKRRELETILDLADGASPSVDVAFQGTSCGTACTDITNPACSCTQPSDYWSASVYAPEPVYGWIVGFDVGETYWCCYDWATTAAVRAVRGRL